MTRHALILTTHTWRSGRRAGFHWIADSLWRRGWNVCFASELTWVDKLRGDYRFQLTSKADFNRVIQEKERFHSYVGFSCWRPFNTRIGRVDALTSPWFEKYSAIAPRGLDDCIQRADLVVFESYMWLMKFDIFKEANPEAKFVYRVSDNLDTFNVHPVVLQSERRNAPKFDLISAPVESTYNKFRDLPNARLQRHGIPLHLYQREHQNPYRDSDQLNAVFAGNLVLDVDFIQRAAQLRPDIDFHMFGDHKDLPTLQNVIAHGEVDYLETIPYVKYADIGLNPLTANRPSSNKMLQYAYCRLPVVASNLSRLSSGNPEHIFFYQPGDDKSIEDALDAALGFDRTQINRPDIWSWDDLVDSMLAEVELDSGTNIGQK